MSQDLRQAMKLQAAYLLQHVNVCRLGLVTGTTPNGHMVKVTLQPENVQTGWLPVLSPFVGNGWGLVARLSYNDQVVVLFQEGSLDCGVVVGALFSKVDKEPDNQSPPTDITGQFWLEHKSGSLLTFTNDGKVAVTSSADMNLSAGGDMNLSAGGSINLGSNTNVTGTLKASVDVEAGAANISLVNHRTTLVEPGSGISGPPQ